MFRNYKKPRRASLVAVLSSITWKITRHSLARASRSGRMKKNFLNDDKALEISVSRRLESVGRRDRPEYGRVLQRQNSGEVKRAFAWSERSSRSGARSHQAKACAKPGQRFERASGPAS